MRAIIHAADEGFWGEVASRPGCVTQAESIDELRTNLREAVEAWIEAGALTSQIGEKILRQRAKRV